MRKLVIIGSVVLLLLTGAKAFATVDSGSQFGSWYVKWFGSIESEITEWVEAESLAMQGSILNYANELFAQINLLLDPTGTINSTKDSINNQKEQYKAKIEEAKNNLVTDEFQEIEEDEKEKIHTEIDQDIEDFLKEYLSR